MAVIDSNEVSAFLRVCQDAGALNDIANLLEERIELLQTPKGKSEPSKAFISESNHTSGGDKQPPLVGPYAGLAQSTSTAQQAAINDALIHEQVSEDRHGAGKADPVTVTVDDSTGSEPRPAESPKAMGRPRKAKV